MCIPPSVAFTTTTPSGSRPVASNITEGKRQRKVNHSRLTAYKLNTATHTCNNDFFGHKTSEQKQKKRRETGVLLLTS